MTWSRCAPGAAFTSVTHRWRDGAGHPRAVRQLYPELTGFEMVVASANNAAVENVTAEIPAQKAIAEEWRGTADYFAGIATEVLRRQASDDPASASGLPVTAWGLVAARLGRKQNRSAFYSAFWFDEKEPTGGPRPGAVPRLQTRLRRWRDGDEAHKTWAQARDDFTRAGQKVDALIQERHQAQDRLRRLPQLTGHADALVAAIGQTREQLARIQQDLARHEPAERHVAAARAQAAANHDRHLLAKPGALETIFTLGRAVRDWRVLLQPLTRELRAAERRDVAALQLHQDFLANAAADMLDGLRAAGEVVAGNYPHDLEPDKLRAAWQLFFLVVPLVSTTFASAGRMFGGIGPEAIGWLLIDEAGQACPQYAAGAIWRARRVVAVGDPLQLEPVVTMPEKAQRDIAKGYRIAATWIPPQASVQTLADRVTTFGTTLDQGEKQVWVSAPLRVHRRCDDPMFTLCNQIAYSGLMVNGVHRQLDAPGRPDRFDSPTAPLIAASYWADEPGHSPGSHLQPNQIERFEKALAYLSGQGIEASEVIAISPFRAVADQLRSLIPHYPGLRAGTIHTAQGREAPVVVLVLGGDPAKPGVPDTWAKTPNLVNVAASRAQRRLYVIGDRAFWSTHSCFCELSRALG